MRHSLLNKLPIFTTVFTHLTCRTLSIFSVASPSCFNKNPFTSVSNCPIDVRCNRINRAYFSSMPPVETSGSDISSQIDELIKKQKALIFSKSWCPFCKKAKNFFDSINVPWFAIELDEREDGPLWQETLLTKTGKKTVPQIFVDEQFIGGCDDLLKAGSDGKLSLILSPKVHDYDLVVIGGGSGGLACVKEAGRLGRKVALINYVSPSPRGSRWGLGGTCVNVGCIPKKLFHTAALVGQSIRDSSSFGWMTNDNDTLDIQKNVHMDWKKLVKNVQTHIKSLNFGYKVSLRKKNVEHINAIGTLEDAHTIKLSYDNQEVKYITADSILIAVGTRPNYPNIPGAMEYGITSDDLFSMPYPPGKTLVVGASYVALECASFLQAFGFDTTVMVRSILLRGFDQECANRVGEIMEHEGIKFIRDCVPESIEQITPGEPGLLRVRAKLTNGESIVDEFNTVVFAIGRSTRFDGFGIDKLGIQCTKSGKILIKNEQTNIPNIFAVGDCTDIKFELAPLAIEAGFLLARRLYACTNVQTDYDNIPTTVFTSVEYSSAGLTEEEAVEKYGQKDIEIFVQNFTPLEWTLPHRPENKCYAKLICAVKENMRVLGIHYVGPNAGEVMQMAALCLKKSCNKDEFDALIGIHPTCAEIFTTLAVTKRSGVSADAQGC
ncbi:thioredoxin reductase 1, cytoplasmic [Tetranychus urticae]|uniref:thioredoxin-disulfide reductase (NADPH) n=1 Tax=Tetranychus urticae TaxID=32264 RepID=T1KYH6_TETUR|nr:thioredoxin reductase 1, cytoplasmic [Tetranychus urticae]